MVPWDRKKWEETKHRVKQMEDDYSLSNSEIQDKILETLEEENSVGL